MSWDFLHPGRLWLLGLLALLAVAVVAGAAQRRRRAVRFTNLDLLDQVSPARPGWRRHLVTGLLFLGFAVGVLGLAQPYRSQRVADSRSIIMLDLDVSLSMEATDVTPSRLEAAQEQAKRFVAQVDPSIEIGLESFSQSVKLRVPPTLDRTRVTDAIDSLQLEQGTAIGDAIIQTTQDIAREYADGSKPAPKPLSPKGSPAAIVLLTDGETVEGLTPGPEGAKTAAEYGIPVYGIAFGTPDGTVSITDPNTGQPVDQPVPVKYDELTQAAQITGGKFYKAETAGSLGQVYDDIQRQLDPVLQRPEPKVVELTLRYLAVALLLLAVAFVVAQLLLGGLV